MSTGGATTNGTLFKISSSGTFTKLKDINGSSDGSQPSGSLVDDTDDNFYGMCSASGLYGGGTIFKMTNSGTFTKLMDFNGTSTGINPQYASFLYIKAPVITNVSNSITGFVGHRLTINGTGLLTAYQASLGNTIVDIISKTDTSLVLQMPNYTTTGFINLSTAGGNIQSNQFVTIIYPILKIAVSNSSKVYGSPNPLFTSSVSGLLDGDLIQISYITDATDTSDVGTYLVSPSVTGNMLSSYILIIYNNTLTVTKMSQTITGFPILSSNYLTIDSPVSFANSSATSGLTISVTSSNIDAVSITGTNLIFIAGGVTTITAMQPGNHNYDPAETVMYVVTITKVTKAPQTITGFPILSTTYLSNNLPISFVNSSSTSGLTISVTSSNIDAISISGTNLIFIAEGVTTITAMQPGNHYYDPAKTITYTVTVTKMPQTITGFPILSSNYLTIDSPVSFANSSATSGLTISVTSSNIDAVSISGTNLIFIAEGVTTITAIQPGNHNYDPAETVMYVVIVTKAPQTITGFPILSSNYLTIDSPVSFANSSATSGLSISVTSSNINAVSISGTNLIFIAEGVTTITAIQPGNHNYDPAETVMYVVTITNASYTTVVQRINKTLISIYPNPNSGSFKITISGGLQIQAELINSFGIMIKVLELKDTTEINDILPGLYLLKIGSETKKILVE